jgi:hypothetical protein
VEQKLQYQTTLKIEESEWRIRAAASQRPQQLIRLRFLSKTGFPSVEWITVDYALLECALGSLTEFWNALWIP